jgi:sulfite exporter TauE/SafE
VFAVQKKNPYKSNADFAIFSLDWFGLLFYFGISSDAITPNWNEVLNLLSSVIINLHWESVEHIR